MAIIRGNDLSNLLIGTSGDDVIFGNGGDDTISGGAGSDRILGGSGADNINGGLGNDIIEYRGGLGAGPSETINGGSGFDTLLFSSAGSVPDSGTIQFGFNLAAVSSLERMQFSSGLNNITVNFYVNPTSSIQFLSKLEFMGGAGTDAVIFHLNEGSNLDLRGATFTNWKASDHVTIFSGISSTTVNGSGQADDIWAEGTQSLLKGNGGDDTFHYSNSSLTTIDGGAGNDCIVLDYSGSLLNTWISRVEEIRFQYSGPSTGGPTVADFFSNSFDVGVANPLFHFVDADAVINAVRVFMTDADTIFSAAGFTFENWDPANLVAVAGGINDDTITGSVVNDALFGNAGNDYLHGGLGNDQLFGQAGNDRMNGGDGDDYLSGDGGRDMLTGGAGSDTFAFVLVDDSSVGAVARDVIMDFAIGDKVELWSLDASATLTGDQAFALDTDSILTEGEIQFIGNLNTLIRVNLDADPEADMEILLRGVAPASLSASDFIL